VCEQEAPRFVVHLDNECVCRSNGKGKELPAKNGRFKGLWAAGPEHSDIPQVEEAVGKHLLGKTGSACH